MNHISRNKGLPSNLGASSCRIVVPRATAFIVNPAPLLNCYVSIKSHVIIFIKSINLKKNIKLDRHFERLVPL